MVAGTGNIYRINLPDNLILLLLKTTAELLPSNIEKELLIRWGTDSTVLYKL